MYSIKVLVPLCLSLLLAEAKRDAGKLAACAGKSIYVMDIGIFSKENGMPSCNLATVRGALKLDYCKESMQKSTLT